VPVIVKEKRKKSSAWLLHYNTRTSCIHHRCVVGATISTRAAHSNPNLGQVKSVEGAKKDDLHNLTQEVSVWSRKTGGEWKVDTKRVRIGYQGGYGFECRSLFRPKRGFKFQTGIDLSGIEMRALGARLRPFDDGEFLAEVTTTGKDPHITNGIAFGLASDLAEAEAIKPKTKRLFYAMVYGGGEPQLGSIILPPGSSAEAMRARGRDLKENFLRKRPAFRRLLKAIEAEARKGYVVALDGSPLPVRKAHAALNLKLQSDAAIIATKWSLLTDERLQQGGIVWGEDYTMLAYIHDEIQFGAKEQEVAFRIGDVALQAAWDAGEFFGYAAPIAAEAKVGRNWGEAH
jgi:DNA polymerase I-like protein with 3'-5' exonuclease and polymerase domains